MEALKSSFLNPTPLNSHSSKYPLHLKSSSIIISCSGKVSPDPWSLSDGNNNNKPKPKSKNRKNPLSDDNARRIIKGKARYLSALRRNQGSRALTPAWIKRSPEQLIQYLEDDRNGHLYGRHVVAAIQRVRGLSGLPDGSYDMRRVMASFVTKLTFREMCTVLKEQRNWRQVRDFLAWMKLQLTYRPSVIVYTLVLRTYGQAGKIKLAEETFLEMLEDGCEPDEVACGTMLCAYAKWGRHNSMLSFHSALQERGITVSVSVYNFMLSSLQKKSLHQSVSEVWRQMLASGGVAPDHFTYTVVITSLVKTGFIDEAFTAFKEMKSMGFVPEEATYSLLITLCSQKGIQDEGSRLYEDMRQHKLVPSNFTCASLLSMYYRSGNYSKALSLFSEMEKYKVVADEVIYGLLIRIYGKLGLYEDAMTTFQEIENSGMLSDDKTYITMAKVHLNAGNYEKALDVMEKMRSRNFKFSRFANIVMLQCFVMKKDTEGAEDMIQALSDTGFPDCSSCTNMLSLYMKLGFTTKAKEFIIKMRKNQVKFDKVLLKAAVKVYCKENMLSDCEQMIRELIKDGLLEHDDDGDKLGFVETISMVINGEFTRLEEADSDSLDPMAFELLLTLVDSESKKMEKTLKLLLKTRNGLLTASQLVNRLMKEGLTYKAEAVFDLLLKLGYKPEMSTICCMIYSYGKQNRMEVAKQVCGVIVSDNATRKHLYNTMINVYIKSSKVDDAYLFYQEENKKGRDFGDVAISMLVNALTTCGKHREAGNVINDCLLKNMELDTVAYNTFIKAMLDAGRLNFAGSIYDRMLTNGVTPSIQTINTMITVHGRNRDLDKAIEMFKNARIKGMPLDEKAYTNIICYYGKAGRSGEASILFKQMQEEGIKPGHVSYNIMMNAYASTGLYKEAKQVFTAMKKDGFTPDSFTYLGLVRAAHKYTEVEEAIGVMEKEGTSASCAHYKILLNVYAKEGMVGEVERVFYEEMITRCGLSPDVGCYGTMFRVYLDYGYVEKGISLFENIGGSVKEDRFIMSVAVCLYRHAGLGEKAEGVLSCMNSLGIPFLNNLVVGSKGKLNIL